MRCDGKADIQLTEMDGRDVILFAKNQCSDANRIGRQYSPWNDGQIVCIIESSNSNGHNLCANGNAALVRMFIQFIYLLFSFSHDDESHVDGCR